MPYFTDKFDSYVVCGDAIESESEGFTLRAHIESDDDSTPPWDREDGHGPVTKWERRDKEPGEMILSDDRGSRRFYDFREACALALRDGWGPPLYRSDTEHGANGLVRINAQWFHGKELTSYATDWSDDINAAHTEAREAFRASFPSARAYAAAAALADFQTLKAWCSDEWDYCGVVVTVSRAGVELATDSLWGIERNYPRSDNAYLAEVAEELAESALDAARAKLEELAQ